MRLRPLFRHLLRRPQQEQSLDEELRAYVDELTDRYRHRGLSAEAARRQALLDIGGLDQLKEQVRDTWLGQSLETTRQDLLYAVRSLRRSPGFSLLIVATLSLGLGASLAMLTLVNAILWRPLPYPDAPRLVTLQVDARQRVNVGATPGELVDLRQRSQSFSHLSTLDSVEANLEYQGLKEHVDAISASDDLAPLLGVRPALGRLLHSPLDSSAGHPRAILISDQLWRRRFGARPSVIGQSVRLNDFAVQVVGVLPPGFRLYLAPSTSAAEQPDIWLPAPLTSARQYRGLPIVGRLRPGVTLQQANTELTTLAAQFQREHPDFYLGANGWQASPADRGPGARIHFQALPLQDDLTQESRPALLLLTGAVGLVLLIACVNAAHLMLARGSARQREFEIRRALGAGQARLVRQLLAESLVLASGSVALGLVLARLALAALPKLGDSHLPLQSRVQLDAVSVAFALFLALLTSVLFGLLPALRLASGPAAASLHTGRAESAGAGNRRLQRTLVIAEIALSIVPLACGGLMLRSFLNLLHTPLGFDPEHVITAKVPFNLRERPQTALQHAWLLDVLTRVQSLSGVASVSAAHPLPLAPNQALRRVGRLDQPQSPPLLATQQGAMPGYLHVMGTPLLAGRDFTHDDVLHQRPVVIIDERLARQLWPDGALGRRLVVYRTGWRSDLEVIGIIPPVRATRVRDDQVPHFMMPSVETTLVIRTHLSASGIDSALAAAVNAVPGTRGLFDIRPLNDYVADSLGDVRFFLLVLAAFAAVALLLATIGLYGTLAYLTAQRTHEFGIRLALGATAPTLIGIVLRESASLAIAGTALGLAGAAAAIRTLRGLLYQVQPLDLPTLAGLVTLVGFIAVLAAAGPAWRTTRIAPQSSLRA